MGRVTEGASDGVVRGHVAVVTGFIGVVCCSSSSAYSCLLHPSSPPFRDNFFYGAFRCQSCHKCQKRQGHSAEMQKTQGNATVLNNKNARSAFSNAG